MTPQPNQSIQVRFNNGVFFDAIVESWSDQKSVLRLPDTDEIVIIQKTLQDVLLVKIIAQNTSEKQSTSSNKSIPENPQEIYNEFEQRREQSKTPDNLKRMAELKDEMNRLEREEIAKKIKAQEIAERREIKYGIPRTIKITSTAQHSPEEIRYSDFEFDQELSRMFGEEDS